MKLYPSVNCAACNNAVRTRAPSPAWSRITARICVGRSTPPTPLPPVISTTAVDYPTYMHQVGAACRAGASGRATGRIVWQKAGSQADQACQVFSKEVALVRLEALTKLCAGLAHP